jgi:hypothetical protein
MGSLWAHFASGRYIAFPKLWSRRVAKQLELTKTTQNPVNNVILSCGNLSLCVHYACRWPAHSKIECVGSCAFGCFWILGISVKTWFQIVVYWHWQHLENRTAGLFFFFFFFRLGLNWKTIEVYERFLKPAFVSLAHESHLQNFFMSTSEKNTKGSHIFFLSLLCWAGEYCCIYKSSYNILNIS